MSSSAGTVRAGIRIEWLTIGWMTVEATVSVAAGLTAGSIALIAFGVDSVIELISAATLLWRLRLEDAGPAASERIEQAERQASRIVGASLLALAAYVALQSGYDLWTRSAPERSLPGIVVAAAALVVMPALVRAKVRVASTIGSAALRGDAACGVVCAYMAATLLAGLVLRAAFGWWWADPVAALGIVYFIVHEGREALAGARDGCCD
ncbi:MAG TPA: cation transporter [bacterium]|nr:cation transporter [bacterium]